MIESEFLTPTRVGFKLRGHT